LLKSEKLYNLKGCVFLKNKLNILIDKFEDKFNIIVDIVALIGSIVTIIMSITISFY